MSFLNPVSEPVLRFKSTDAGAPQINYNSRTAGDIKAVLKACLVDGYGAIDGAGWTAANEVSNVIEFVSPSAAMNDYRLGIDDTSTTKTDWFYQYQDARVNPSSSAINKNIANINKTHTSNGWQLLVTERGLYFIEIFYVTDASAKFGRLTFFGRVKSSLKDDGGKNIGFWCVGHSAKDPDNFFTAPTTAKQHYELGVHNSMAFGAANLASFGTQVDTVYTTGSVDFSSEVYLYSAAQMVAQQVGLLLKYNNDADNRFGVYDAVLDGRDVLTITMSYADTGLASLKKYARQVLLRTDSWEY